MIKAIIFDMYETLISLECGRHYFGPQMAIDAGISKENFLSLWLSSKVDRTIGKCSLEDAVTKILRSNDRYSDELLSVIVRKRKDVNKEAFNNRHPDITQMLKEIKNRGMLLGLISNCFSEEVALIEESELFPLFDTVCLSFKEGVCKPNREIYRRCIKDLGVNANECLYVGDGDNNELVTAKALGMKVIQAAWYIKKQPECKLKYSPKFYRVDEPMDIIKFIESIGANEEIQ